MKTKEEREKDIPEQREGNKMDVAHSVEASSLQEARQLFAAAASRLLNVNIWDKLSGPLSATFRLTDSGGNEISGPARPGDYFKIDIPAPGPAAGKGYDWVRIEKIEERPDASASEESVTMRVRPSPSPLTEDHSTAHFFKEEATSSFRVQRTGTVVTAEVYGRNEIPNTETDKTVDKVRNAVVGLGAITAFSAPQWKSLVKGLLSEL